MNDVQRKLAELQGKGWTLAAIADAIGITVNAVEKWKAGVHNPANPTLLALNGLKKKRPPKKRRYSNPRFGVPQVQQPVLEHAQGEGSQEEPGEGK